uniref:Uncharacterized protein n=1 Tax=Aegilops tauschii subsp. strangulata TaxID=200361 RepID=A0A453MFH4_AEGTS
MESISQQQVIKHGCSHRDELADHINKVNATELKEILRLLLSSDLLFGLHLLLCWFIICSVGELIDAPRRSLISRRDTT